MHRSERRDNLARRNGFPQSRLAKGKARPKSLPIHSKLSFVFASRDLKPDIRHCRNSAESKKGRTFDSLLNQAIVQIRKSTKTKQSQYVSIPPRSSVICRYGVPDA